jgi:curved DNA-binding protein CbpA
MPSAAFFPLAEFFRRLITQATTQFFSAAAIQHETTMKLWRSLRQLWTLALIHSLVAEAQYYPDDPQFLPCRPDKVEYEWERLNFYELLGLSWPNDMSLDSKEIRKAYREQSRTWHPDKRRPDDSISIEEINSRFSVISQAYQTLSDGSKKHAYDRFLEQCERRNQEPTNGGQSHRKNGDYFDPHNQRYQHYNQYDRYQQNYDANRQQQRRYYDPYHQKQQYPGSFDGRQQSFSYRNMQQQPSNVRRSQEMLYDPMSGAPIFRETIFEEYNELNYFRVLVEDFLVQPMDAWGNSYRQPIYPTPVVVEEGELSRP